MPSRRGFTLLELLVVVIVIGVLASVALPNYNRMIEKTRVRDAQGTLNMIFQAERVYRLDNASYGTLAQLIAGNYLPDPNVSADWTYATSSATATAFQADATRSNATANTISLNENFTGRPIAGAPYNGKAYIGNHPQRD
ncbi:MAG: prepilin-type N-terminal cleavage/methylation domain-containing protein [Candidatus Omnitrophica bacterium]|nr:prepilin-type N-terminal cleavage/methylation domain-containing protein [Candidatus Omnitrophota bacterium]